MPRTIIDIPHILPSMLKKLIFLGGKNAHCYCVPPAKILAGKPTPTKLSCFPLKNILKSHHEKSATVHSKGAGSKPCSFRC